LIDYKIAFALEDFYSFNSTYENSILLPNGDIFAALLRHRALTGIFDAFVEKTI
jgi:hypothetical protein